MDGLNFGTSGLRGLVTALEGWPSHAYTIAFLRHLQDGAGEGLKARLYCGRDLRSSSPGILATCLAAAAAAGFEAVDCGALPTPALAYAALGDGCPAIMVTGSHIPDDRNGLKFYNRQGEITKLDEAGIRQAFEGVGKEMPTLQEGNESHPAVTVDHAASERYARRYLDFFLTNALAGSRIGVFTHSSVARDLLLEVLSQLGAIVTDLGRSDSFVPVDTEAHRPEDVERIGEWAWDGRFDAIVSADGDGDRPLIADETGRILRGDIVGLITARHFGLTTIVTPITSSSAIETSAVADRVVRTKVGSPFVIEGMAKAALDGDARIAGFEANGGFMLFSDLRDGDRVLSALPTRDALLPILAVLIEARKLGSSVQAIVAELNAGHAAAHRLQEVPMAATQAFLDRLGTDAAFREQFFVFVGAPTGINDMDGCKIGFSEGRSIHFRRSGNAPELRCYVEARTEAEAHELLDRSLSQARDAIAANSATT